MAGIYMQCVAMENLDETQSFIAKLNWLQWKQMCWKFQECLTRYYLCIVIENSGNLESFLFALR